MADGAERRKLKPRSKENGDDAFRGGMETSPFYGDTDKDGSVNAGEKKPGHGDKARRKEDDAVLED